MEARERGGDLFGRALGEKRLAHGHVFLRGLFGEGRILHDPLAVALADVFRRGRARPFHIDAGRLHEAFGLAAAGVGHEQDADALAARAAGAAAAVKQRLVVVRQVGVDDEAEIRQVDAAGRDVGGDADARASVAQRLQGVVALALAQLARQGDGREAALEQACLQMPHRLAGVAEHHGGAHLVEAQHVDDRVLDLVGRDADRPVFDVAMRLVRHQGVDAQRIPLELARQRRDVARDGGREQQRAPLRAAWRRG